MISGLPDHKNQRAFLSVFNANLVEYFNNRQAEINKIDAHGILEVTFFGAGRWALFSSLRTVFKIRVLRVEGQNIMTGSIFL